jgi:flagellum-specific peptidoglycan hydrolase FlgJ
MAQIARRQNEIMASENVTVEEAAKRAQAELMAQQGATQSFTSAQQAVAGSAKDLQNLSFTLVRNVTPAVDAFASGLKKVTGYIDQKFGGTPSAVPAAMGGPAGTRGPADLSGGKSSGPASQTQKEFLDTMYNSLLDAAKKQGVKNPEVIAKLGAAQSALETGYGKHLAGGQNYFGIKARPGEGGTGVATQEFENGRMVTKNQNFRKYGSMQESAADYVKFLTENKRYKGVLGAGSLEEAISEQSKTGYATDPLYGSKLSGIAGKMTGPVSGYRATTTTDPNTTLARDTAFDAASRRAESDDQVSWLAQLNESLERLNQTARAQVDVSTKIYRASA